VRVEAAAYHGKPVSFSIVGPWTKPTRMAQPAASSSSRVIAVAASSLSLLLLAATVALARHNLRVGRGDRRGAGRLAIFMLSVLVLSWLFTARHRADLPIEINQFFVAVAFSLLNTGIMWLLYIALEPYVRRYCPELLFSWTRGLNGQIRDPRVGRDVLIGAAVGVGVAALICGFRLLPTLFGAPGPTPKGINYAFLLGARYGIGIELRTLPNAMQNAMFTALCFVLVRAISGRTWVAATAATLMFSTFVLGEAGDSLVGSIAFALLFSGAYIITLVYFGLVAQVVAFFVQMSLVNAPITADMSKLYAATSVWLIVMIAGLAVFGFYASRAGQPLFGHLLPRE
jgi:serine/threonine-protein kinase